MKPQDILTRLETIENSIKAKGHPMQDYSTLKIALIDLIEIIREMIKND